MARKRVKNPRKVVVDYPPVPTRKWIPPDKRVKRKKPKPPPYPPQLTQKLTISSLLKVWHDYKVVNDCAVLLGDVSLFHPRFSYITNGMQGHAICIVCALYSKLCPCYHWCSKTLDEIAILGDRFYQRSMRFKKINGPLPIELLNKDWFIHSHKITICLKGETYHGLIFKDLEANSKDYLANIIKCFFETHDCGVLYTDTTPKRYFAIWKFRRGYFLFDPTDHDEMCWPLKRTLQGKGHTFVVRFTNSDRLVQVLQRQLTPANMEFDLIPVNIERIVFINTRYPACLEETNEEMDPVSKNRDAAEQSRPRESIQLANKPSTEFGPTADNDVDAAQQADSLDIGGALDEDETEEKDIGAGDGKKQKFKKKPIIEKPRVQSVTFFNYIVPDRIGIMLAETHQDDPEFANCYSKDICMVLGALIHLREAKAKYWTSRILTNALRLGYRIGVESLMLIQPQRILKIKNIIKKISLNDKFYTPVIEQYGAIGRLQSTDAAILDLLPALKEVFSEHDTVILQGPFTVALWKENDLFYMFDSHERDPNGFAIVKEIDVGTETESVDYIGGVACLTWFRDLHDLVDMYMANVERNQRHEPFIISTVAINDYVQLPENWNYFKAICPEKWILQGSFAQSDLKFPKETRNTQCTANCAIAIAYCHIIKVNDWTTATIDEILDEGDQYYAKCVEELNKKEKFSSPMLLLSELITDITLCDYLVCFDFSECLINGVITIPEEFRTTLNLYKGASEFFKDNDFGIITCRGISIAVFKSEDAYFYFDSHDRNEYGFYVVHGKACVQRFLNLNKMVEVIMGNLGPDVMMAVYNISKVDVKTYKPIKVGEQPDEDDSLFPSMDEEDANEPLINKLVVERPLFNFTKITKKRAILRSNFHQGDDIQFDVSAGKQTVPNLMVAPAMARVFEPNEWSVDILDDVLRTGQIVYDSSLQAFYRAKAVEATVEEEEEEEETDEITIMNVDKEFKIGVNKFTAGFELICEDIVTNDGSPLEQAIKAHFADAPKDDNDFKELILHTEMMDVVIWKRGTLYYLFDPRARDERGCIYGKEEWSPLPPELPEWDHIEEDYVEALYDKYEDDSMYATADEVMDPGQEQLEQEWTKLGHAEDEGKSIAPVIEEKRSHEYWEEKAKNDGRAYILWFTKPKHLIRHLIANTPPMLRNQMEFQLYAMSLVNEPEVKDVYDPACGPKPDGIAGDWFDWKEITHGQWILRGTMHQGNVIFPETNRGLQAHANSLIALSFAYMYMLAQFTPLTVDEIIKYGDRLYTSTKKVRRKELLDLSDPVLSREEIDDTIASEIYTIDNIIKTFCVGDESVAIKVVENEISGEVHAQEIENVLDVNRGLAQFFESGNKLGVLSAKNQTVAVFRMGIFYYMFDPHERGPHGQASTNGVACLTRFCEIAPLAELFVSTIPRCGKNFFSIREVHIGIAPCNKPVNVEKRRVDDPLKLAGFEPVVPGKMIICGTISQEDPKFGRSNNVQAAPIATVALAMSLLHNVEYWTKIIIDDIVNVGDDVYDRFIERCDIGFNPWEEKLTLALAPKDFKIGKNKVNFELRATDQAGLINSRPPGVVDLKHGIKNFFEENNYGVLETDLLTAAIWKEEANDEIEYLYMFDPNPRTKSGMPAEEKGVACVMRFVNAYTLAAHIISLMPNEGQGQYLLTPVEMIIERDGKKVRKTKKYGTRKIPKGESVQTKRLGRFCYYKIPSGNVEILRGTKSQSHKCYSPTSRDKQDVPNCIIAYVVDKLIPMSRWTCKNIDMILDLGDLLFRDSYMVYNPRDEKIGLETLIRDVVIQDIRVKISVGAPVLTAQFSRRLLTEALVACFNLKNFCIVLLDVWAVALFKKCETYYMFDPTDLDLHGNRIERCGSAAVMRFDDIGYMIEAFMHNMDARPLENEVFKIIIAAVKQIERIPVGADAFNERLRIGKLILPDKVDEPSCDKIMFGHPKSHKKKV